jgi:hypothetical protein
MSNNFQTSVNKLVFYFKKPTVEEIILKAREYGVLIVDRGSCDTVCLGPKAMNSPADKTIKGIYWPIALEEMAKPGQESLDVWFCIYAKVPQDMKHPECYTRLEYRLHQPSEIRSQE